jgi:LysR family glycine cleavage system transcriptional activator
MAGQMICMIRMHNIYSSTMNKKLLPPLTTLRGFEAAARHLSFTFAADELYVTQSAISRQVRQLESFLGVLLFKRLTRRVELTCEGQEYYQLIKDQFYELERASERYRLRESSYVLTISVLPTIASRWLMPRLDQFSQFDGKTEIHIVSSIEPVNFIEKGADIAIRVGRLPGEQSPKMAPRIDLQMVTSWTDITADRLFPDILAPVCVAGLLDGCDQLRRVEDLLKFPLIHTATRRHAWPDWLRAHGVREIERDQKGAEYGHFFMSLEAARKGLGIALIPEILLQNCAATDGLARPWPADIASAGEYYLLIPDSRLDNRSVQSFRSWILTEARATSAANC